MNRKEALLVQERPKLAQALAGKEINFRYDLKKAREAQGYAVWQVAERLGWSIAKVCNIESVERDILSSDLRKYLLAVGCYVEFTIKSEGALG